MTDEELHRFLNHEICGVRYNVVRRPLSGGKGNIKQHEAKTTKARYGTGKNSGKLLAPAVHTPAETLEEFVERLRRDYIAADPEYWFFRIISRVSKDDMMDFKRQCLDPLLENVADDAEWFVWCLENNWNHWDYRMRAAEFREHAQRHFRFPFGVWLPLNEGGATDYDHHLETGGSEAGLRRTDRLFPELNGE